MIERKTDMQLVRAALRRNRVVILLGPRQCGKTTLARQFVLTDALNYFDRRPRPRWSPLAALSHLVDE